jgi:hypothetical protein
VRIGLENAVSVGQCLASHRSDRDRHPRGEAQIAAWTIRRRIS